MTDDSPITRKVLHELCVARGFDVAEAYDGEEGVRMARASVPDLILLDLEMPKLDGLSALSRIRDEDPTVPVVIVSGTTDAEITERALSLGAVNLIRKPFDTQEIQFVLDQIYKALAEQTDFHDVLELVEMRATSLSFGGQTGILSKVVAFLGRELVNAYPGFEVPITEIKLALYEALANAYEHGNLAITFDEKSDVLTNAGGIQELIRERLEDPKLAKRRIHIKASYRDNSASYFIRDEGEGFDHDSHVNKPVASATALHGRGITLIGHYMDDVSWNESGNEIRLVKRLRLKGVDDSKE